MGALPGELERRWGRRVVTAFPMNAAATAVVRQTVGDDVRIIDIRVAQGDEELVVSPPVSRQLVDKLKAAFPRARLLVVELDDPAYGLSFGGPVARTLDAGADGYCVASSIEQLAAFLGQGDEAMAASLDRPDVIELAPAHPGLEDLLEEVLAATDATRSRRRPTPARARRP
jgi:hypothetical protein